MTYAALGALAALAGILCGLMLVYTIELPQVSALEQFRPISTTELYDVHGGQVGSFALERRVVSSYDDFPPVLRQAVIAIEDKNFESHWGVNLVRVAGAAWRDLTSGEKRQGASTLTMQLTRNLFFGSERTFSRKLQEVLFSIQVEHHFTKQQIFTLYGNQIYLGHGNYGFEAASEYYFNRHARELTLAQAALLAGIPKSPTGLSPINHPDRAIARRNAVLRAMAADGDITADQENDAESESLGLNLQAPANSEAPYFVEEIRRNLERQFGTDEVHSGGLRVYTTLDLALQHTATRAVLDGLAAYERRHGWKGHLQQVDLNTYQHPDWNIPLMPGAYVHGIVTFVEPATVTIKLGRRAVTLLPDGWRWTGFRSAHEFLHVGDVVYVHLPDKATAAGMGNVTLEQDSGAQGALLAIDNSSGDVLAMVGGRDYQLSQFNRATQAFRQTGSSFKPFVYAAAVENGAKPEDRIEDSPATFGAWTPHNFDDQFKGNMSLLAAFADSRNIPAVRLADRVGIRRVIDLAHRCGIQTRIPDVLPVALGAASLTLEEQTAAYTAFPNDGVRVPPRLLRRVTAADGRVLQQSPANMSPAMSAATAKTMLRFLEEVTRSGTGAAASQLHHPVAGKTGTTNGFTDAWFMGFSPSITVGVWIGYDSNQSLGEKETGAKAALPIWMDFMRAAAAMHPGEHFAGARPDLPVVSAKVADREANADADTPPAAEEPDTDGDAKPAKDKPADEKKSAPKDTPAPDAAASSDENKTP